MNSSHYCHTQPHGTPFAIVIYVIDYKKINPEAQVVFICKGLFSKSLTSVPVIKFVLYGLNKRVYGNY